ncbi:MAG: complex I NDUFA9 subunit family protein [Betaproteobacteria bacterium]|nr:complex I NDUFA9 subunit family protein [Betaproteobacteria bacterium]
MQKNVLLLGGGGFVGRHVCEKLARRSIKATVPTRRLPHAAAVLTLPQVRVVQADLHDPAQLSSLVAGHDAVVNLVAILQGTPSAFERVHVDLPRSLVRACAQTGVRRVVHISALGADEARPESLPSMYLRSKSMGEQLLHRADLDLTVIRPSVIFGAEDRFLNTFARLQRLAPFVPLAGAQAQLQPVWVEDVADAVVACLHGPHQTDSLGRIYEATGPEVYTLRELVQWAGRWAGVAGGRGRPVWPLPEALARLQARLMELMPGEPLLSRDNLDSLRVPNVATGKHPGLADLGLQVSSVRAIAPTYLSGLEGRGSPPMARPQL